MKSKEFQLDLQDFGIVIPTLGERPDYLVEAISSLPSASSGISISIVAPELRINELRNVVSGTNVRFIADPGQGLARALNVAIEALPEKCNFVAWLGDDDLLNANLLPLSLLELRGDPNVVATYGDIDLIDFESEVFMRFRTTKHAAKTIRFGPNRVPQPGSVLRRSAFLEIGGLDESFRFSFDSDMFMRLSKKGEVRYVPGCVASFRWHNESLSAGQSEASIREASRARLQNLPTTIQPIARFWEFIHVKAAIALGKNSFDRKLSETRRR